MIRLKKNQNAMFHTHTLSENAIDFIIRHVDAVKFVNNLEKTVKSYSKDDYLKYEFVRKEVAVLDELLQKIDVWTRKEV